MSFSFSGNINASESPEDIATKITEDCKADSPEHLLAVEALAEAVETAVKLEVLNKDGEDVNLGYRCYGHTTAQHDEGEKEFIIIELYRE